MAIGIAIAIEIWRRISVSIAIPKAIAIAMEHATRRLEQKRLEEAIGRILYPERWRPFIWAARYHVAQAANPGTSPTQGGMRGQATLGPPIWPCSAWGLPCPLRFRRSGALLPHPFTLTPGLSGAVYSLWHFPSRCRGRALPGMPSVVESGPSSDTEVSADARLLQPRQA